MPFNLTVHAAYTYSTSLVNYNDAVYLFWVTFQTVGALTDKRYIVPNYTYSPSHNFTTVGFSELNFLRNDLIIEL